MTEDEMVRWHHQLDGHESEQALGVGDGQGSPWGHKRVGGTEQLTHSFSLSRPLFSWAPKSLQMVTAAMKLKDTCSLGGRKKKKKL